MVKEAVAREHQVTAGSRSGAKGGKQSVMLYANTLCPHSTLPIID